MSKKTIISDFGALKGKVTFSEASGMQESAKRKASEQQVSPAVEKQSKTNESHLKVGQSVVLMDSDLRGKIVSIGRKVLIELEDGLTIEAAYGEFAVTDATELKALKSSKVKAKKTSGSASNKKPASGILEVDLHIEAICKLVQVYHTIGKVSIFAESLEGFLHFVVLIPDFANQFFQNIFHGDNAQGTAVLIHNDRNMGLGSPKLV